MDEFWPVSTLKNCDKYVREIFLGIRGVYTEKKSIAKREKPEVTIGCSMSVINGYPTYAAHIYGAPERNEPGVYNPLSLKIKFLDKATIEFGVWHKDEMVLCPITFRRERYDTIYKNANGVGFLSFYAKIFEDSIDQASRDIKRYSRWRIPNNDDWPMCTMTTDVFMLDTQKAIKDICNEFLRRKPPIYQMSIRENGYAEIYVSDGANPRNSMIFLKNDNNMFVTENNRYELFRFFKKRVFDEIYYQERKYNKMKYFDRDDLERVYVDPRPPVLMTRNEYEVMLNSIGLKRDDFGIKNVIFNNPATIVYWKDGTKTVVKRQKGERWDKEKGLAMAIIKKAIGNKGNYNDIFRKWCSEDSQKKHTY